MLNLKLSGECNVIFVGSFLALRMACLTSMQSVFNKQGKSFYSIQQLLVHDWLADAARLILLFFISALFYYDQFLIGSI